MSLPFYPENKLWESVLQQDTEVSFLFLGFFRGYSYAQTKSSCLRAGAAPPPLQIFWTLSRTFSNETSRVFKAPQLQCLKRLVSGGSQALPLPGWGEPESSSAPSTVSGCR